MRKVLTGLVVVGLLSGCATLPQAGPIRIGPDLSSPADTESFYYSPLGPSDGQTPQEILSGFLAAGTGPQNDYAVAREYLSESIRSSWNPSDEVLIQRSSAQIEFMADDSAIVVVDLSARVDADGRYESVPDGTSRDLEFKFVKENQQWRISQAPDATILIRPVFEVVFRDYAVYFVDRQKRYLVPELRWFPTSAATGTKLANALLRGASSWLRPAVTSAIPSGTRLSIDAVTVVDRVALVDLTSRALVATRADRSIMKAQLEATLSQLPNIEQVAISIERSRQEIPEAVSEIGKLESRQLLALGPEGLQLIGTGESDFFASGTDFFDFSEFSGFAASKRDDFLAAIAPTGVIRTSLSEPGESVELVDQRSNILELDFDPQGFLWSVSRARSAAITIVSPSGESTSLSAPWLAGQAIRGLAISIEGTRVAFLLQGPTRNRVVLSSVIRNAAGEPIELVDAIEIASEVPSPTSISWSGAMQLAVLSKQNDSDSVYLVRPGGSYSTIAAPAETESVISQGSNSPLYALTSDNKLYVFRGSSWSLIQEQIDSIYAVN